MHTPSKVDGKQSNYIKIEEQQIGLMQSQMQLKA